jgi:hypothetical protein
MPLPVAALYNTALYNKVTSGHRLGPQPTELLAPPIIRFTSLTPIWRIASTMFWPCETRTTETPPTDTGQIDEGGPLKRLIILASFCQNRQETATISCNSAIARPTLPKCAREACDCYRHRQRRRLLVRAGDLPSCRIQSPDRKLAPRQRTSFVAIHDRKPLSHVGKNGREFLRPLWGRLHRPLQAGQKLRDERHRSQTRT